MVRNKFAKIIIYLLVVWSRYYTLGKYNLVSRTLPAVMLIVLEKLHYVFCRISRENATSTQCTIEIYGSPNFPLDTATK